MAGFVGISFVRPTIGVEPRQQYSVYIDGSTIGGYREATGGVLEQISGWIDLWPAAQPGYGSGAYGRMPYGRTPTLLPGSGFGRGNYGRGNYGRSSVIETWNSRSVGLKFRDGTYRFEVRFRDAAENLDVGGGTVQSSLVFTMPEPCPSISLDSATATELDVSWTASPDL